MDEPKRLALQDIVNRYSKDTPILEVGFGDGEFLKALAQKGFTNLSGTEVSIRCINEIRRHHTLDNIQLYLANSPKLFEVLRPEVTCCFEVIEHLQDPISFLEKLPGEVLYLSTPNKGRWLPRLTGKYERWDYPPNHLHRFNISSLHRTLSLSKWYTFSLYETEVETHTILRSLYSPGNSESYDDIRPKHKWLTSNIRRALIPVTWCIASLLNWCGYKGISFYVKAAR